MSQGHQPAVLLGPRPGNGHVLGFGCFPGLERKHSLPRDALCFPWTDPSAARGALRGQTLCLCALCHCAGKISFILVLAVPRLCAPISTLSSRPGIRAGSQDIGLGCRFERQQRAAPCFLAAQFCSSGSFRASEMPGDDGGGLIVGRTELLGSANLG